MLYTSTRNNQITENFTNVLMRGLAPDGGLYVPEKWPQILHPEQLVPLQNKSYQQLAQYVITPFLGKLIEPEELSELIENSYATWQMPKLVSLDQQLTVLELFNGPTLSFKDFALQLSAQIFTYVLAKNQQKLNIILATSGDTGSAAIEAFAGNPYINLFVLHPHNKVSERQRLQMTTVTAPNIHNIALQGDFDDCQSIVKTLLAQPEFAQQMNLGAINSINWCRIMAQIVYYAYTYCQLTNLNHLSFCVPTGNFGNIFAGFAAKQMGLDIERLLIASNRNDILIRTLNTNQMSKQQAFATLSPSMDIQISSNFERLVYYASGCDSTLVQKLFSDFKQNSEVNIPPATMQKIKQDFTGQAYDDLATLSQIKHTQTVYNYTADPHTACALACAKELQTANEHIVVLATAHPAKFPDTILQATDQAPPLPAQLAKLTSLPEKFQITPNDIEQVKKIICAAN